MGFGRILFIIEDSSIRKGLEKALHEYIVDISRNIEKGIELTNHYKYSLIITDMVKQITDDADFIKKIKKENPGIGFIILADENSFDSTFTALNYGAINFFTKPVNFQKIKKSVQEIFKMKAILDKTRKIDYFLITSEKTYQIPNDLNLISDLAATLSRDLIISELCSETEILNIDLSLVEMLTNSIEHGNLEISDEEKVALITKGSDEYIQEITKRSKIKPYSDRIVTISTSIDRDKVKYMIRDEGKGFDYKTILDKLSKKDVLRINGRGIIMTISAMDEVIYEEKGNVVTLVKYFKQPVKE